MGVIPANADYALTLSLKVANASSSTTTSSDYALIIPSAFTITQSGWNEITDGITAKVSGDLPFDSGYKLTVTAATDSTLTAEGSTDTISYTLKSRDAATEAITAWEFSADELNASKDNVITGTTKTLGVDVEDYSTKANGDYSDTITFTASVEKTGITLGGQTITNGSTITISFQYEGDNSATFTYQEGAFTASWQGQFFTKYGDSGGARMSIQGGNLIAEICDYENFADADEINTITLYPAANTWTFSKGQETMDTSDYTFAVNGVDITSQLTQQ